MKKIVIVALIVLFLAIAGAGLFSWLNSPPGTSRAGEFSLERGWGARRTASALQDSGMIRNQWMFLLEYRRSFREAPLLAGRYLLSDTMTSRGILEILTSGMVIPEPTTWITLPPGLRLEESLGIISDSMGFPMEDLQALAGDPEFLEAMGVPCLEGYLYPETYEFADTLPAWAVINRIVATGQTVMDSGWEQSVEEHGLTPFQGVILASIVEREAVADVERDRIAGVFLNRLRTGMRLESCATVQYALGEVRERLLYSDLEVESPYNTYRHQGLPPGPICSPGAASLYAAAEPDTAGGFLFFVSRGDGSGEHLFATTAAGHARNIDSVR